MRLNVVGLDPPKKKKKKKKKNPFKPSFSLSQSSVYIKNKVGYVLVFQKDQINLGELASNIIDHSLNETYWKGILNNFSSPQESLHAFLYLRIYFIFIFIIYFYFIFFFFFFFFFFF